MEPAPTAPPQWSPQSTTELRPSRVSFVSAVSQPDLEDVQEVEPTQQAPAKFVELRDVNNNGSRGPPQLSRRPSKLSRSSTLHSLADMGRQRSQQHNQYQNFNHHDWLTSIRWIFKGQGCEVFVMWGIIFMYTLIAVIVVEASGNEDKLDLETDVTYGLGGCMALLLAFRLNVCFSRWWEGRLLWGRVIESSRSLVTLALSLEADFEPGSAAAQTKRTIAEGLAGWSITFALTLKCHLRGGRLGHDEPQVRSIERLLKGKGLSSKHDLAYGTTALQRLRASNHPPLHALRSIRYATRRLVKEMRDHDIQTVGLENTLTALTGELHGALTGCERILRTPCPPGYVGVLRVSLLFFLFLFPFVLLEISYWAIPTTMMTAFVLLGAEEVAIQLEQPFGDDENDLPLDSYCYTLEADLMTILDERLDDADDN